MKGPSSHIRPYDIPETSLRRLPIYYRFLQQMATAGVIQVSCADLARGLGLDPTQVRKDIEMTGIVGKPRVGYPLMDLVRWLENFLGWNRPKRAVLVGAGSGFSEASPTTDCIRNNVAEFLAGQLAAGMIPKSFLPSQSGVGDIANSVPGALGKHRGIPTFEMYTEVLRDSVVALIEQERVSFASSCSFTVTPPALQRVYDNLKWFRSHVVLRPQEISNSPEVVRRLGVISINTAIEVDIFGNANSTHVMGRKLMNGIGGSGDFTRNAYLSVFTCPSTAKGGKISTIVPLVSHVDHSEHSVQIIATEFGVADLRGKSPFERASEIIDKCAHPEYRDLLRSYLTIVEGGHTPHTLSAAFRMLEQFQSTGDMRGASWAAHV